MDDSRASLAVPDLNPHRRLTVKILCSNATSVILPRVPNSLPNRMLCLCLHITYVETGQEEMGPEPTHSCDLDPFLQLWMRFPERQEMFSREHAACRPSSPQT